MKLQKITALAKRTKHVLITKQNDGKGTCTFIGTAQGMYSMRDMPEVGRENVLNLLGITPGKQVEWSVEEKILPITSFKIGDPLYMVGMPVGKSGQILSLRCGDTGVMLDKASLAPIDDLEHFPEYFLSANKSRVVVVSDGRLVASVSPLELTSEFVDNLQKVTRVAVLAHDEN